MLPLVRSDASNNVLDIGLEVIMDLKAICHLWPIFTIHLEKLPLATLTNKEGENVDIV